MALEKKGSLLIWFNNELRSHLFKPVFQAFSEFSSVLDLGASALYRRLTKSTFNKYVLIDPEFQSLSGVFEPSLLEITAKRQQLTLKNNLYDDTDCLAILNLISKPLKILKQSNRILEQSDKDGR